MKERANANADADRVAQIEAMWVDVSGGWMPEKDRLARFVRREKAERDARAAAWVMERDAKDEVLRYFEAAKHRSHAAEVEERWVKTRTAEGIAAALPAISEDFARRGRALMALAGNIEARAVELHRERRRLLEDLRSSPLWRQGNAVDAFIRLLESAVDSSSARLDGVREFVHAVGEFEPPPSLPSRFGRFVDSLFGLDRR